MSREPRAGAALMRGRLSLFALFVVGARANDPVDWTMTKLSMVAEKMQKPSTGVDTYDATAVSKNPVEWVSLLALQSTQDFVRLCLTTDQTDFDQNCDDGVMINLAPTMINLPGWYKTKCLGAEGKRVETGPYPGVYKLKYFASGKIEASKDGTVFDTCNVPPGMYHAKLFIWKAGDVASVPQFENVAGLCNRYSPVSNPASSVAELTNSQSCMGSMTLDVNVDVTKGTNLQYCDKDALAGTALKFPRCSAACTTSRLSDSCVGMCQGGYKCCMSLGGSCIKTSMACPTCPDCASEPGSAGTCPATSFDDMPKGKGTTKCCLPAPPAPPSLPPSPVTPPSPLAPCDSASNTLGVAYDAEDEMVCASMMDVQAFCKRPLKGNCTSSSYKDPACTMGGTHFSTGPLNTGYYFECTKVTDIIKSYTWPAGYLALSDGRISSDFSNRNFMIQARPTYGPHQDMYLSQYCSPKIAETTLERAINKVKNARRACGGVTYEPATKQYTGRQGTALWPSKRGEISYVVDIEKGSYSGLL